MKQKIDLRSAVLALFTISKWKAVALPLLALFKSDAIINNSVAGSSFGAMYSGWYIMYPVFVLIVFFGKWITWKAEIIINYDHEVWLIAPCIFEVEGMSRELHRLTGKPVWNNFSPAKHNAVFIGDYDLFIRPSASRLPDGIRLLATLFHPCLFTVPARLQYKYSNITNISQHVQA